MQIANTSRLNRTFEMASKVLCPNFLKNNAAFCKKFLQTKLEPGKTAVRRKCNIHTSSNTFMTLERRSIVAFYELCFLHGALFANVSRNYTVDMSYQMHDIIKMRKDDICWKCKTKLLSTARFFCGHCDSVIPISRHENYYDIFDLDFRFDITIPELQKKFKDLQRKLHPDKFHLKDPEERAISEENSSFVNKAYFTLLSPLTRAIYMLEEKGILIEEGESCESSDFLMKIMELNEEIADADSIEILQEIRKEIQLIIEDLFEKISYSFKNDDLEQAKFDVKQCKYYNTMTEKLKSMIPPQ